MHLAIRAINLIGFKLKGFKHIFEKYLQPLFRLNDMQFVDLIPAIEAAISELGTTIFDDTKRAAAWKAAHKLAANDNVRVSNLKMAA